ncbi:CBS domain-containing protein [Haloechinothrix sp. LS1_15]|uniref:CBS domain-containing protein n=1 Tax=Haloechinothrix sp. LS1_15 TaxID=2652248 RepID=UPI002945E726|nr:CBS domain-containing protein [Haloechinothrix sp. LS1_15]MDV6012668.1 CBS domain-containing protein [Haloechinothrix sp. LS1_15]
MLTSTVADVMTRDVISVSPTTPFKEAAQLLAEHEISALPVVGPGAQPVGVVSEADLLVKERTRGRLRSPGLLASRGSKRRYRQARATTVGDVMTPKVRTIGPEEPLARAARELQAGRLRRLFVVDGSDALVGVVSRRDVLRVFTRSDRELAETVRRQVLRFALWAPPEEIAVRVVEGEVTLDGVVDTRSEAERAVQLTGQISGVVAVHSKLAFAVDDIEAARA